LPRRASPSSPARRRRPRSPPSRRTAATGLTHWDAHALATGSALAADERDLRTGYADETHSAVGSAPYRAAAARTFYVAPAGFSALVARLARDVRYGARVVDVRRSPCAAAAYEVVVSQRTGHNAFVRKVLRCDGGLFVCVPPGVFQGWTVFDEHARSLPRAVVPGSLHHIYVKSAEHQPRDHVVHGPHSLLGQSVPTQYDDNPWFQAAYTGGRLAWLWQHLRLSSSGAALWARLCDEVRRHLGVALPEEAEHRSHHWPVAYHAWRAVPRFALARAVRASIEPNPVALPRLYVAGEAFSSHQAWMEGALETAELALAADDGRARRPPRCRDEALRGVVAGHELDVTAFAAVHPGGAAALRNHAGEDVGALMAHIGHSDHAWAVAHALKCRRA
jgi:hypothetical protein